MDSPRQSSAFTKAARSRQEDAFLSGTTLEKMEPHFVRAAEVADAGKLPPVMHMGKRSGANLSRLEKTRSFEERKERGRWLSDSSVRCYETRALAQRVWTEMSERGRQWCFRASRQLPDVLVRFVEGGGQRAHEAAAVLRRSLCGECSSQQELRTPP